MSRILVRDNVTISDGDTTTSPDLISRYAVRRVSSNIFHTIVGRAARWLTLGVSRLRAGTFDALYFDRDEAHAALEMHAAAAWFTYTDADQPERNMTYAVEGQCELVHDAKFNHWRLTVEFEEIEP